MKKPSLVQSIILFIIWSALTLFGTLLFTDGKSISLDKLISTQLSYTIIAAAILSVGYVLLKGIPIRTGLTGGLSIKGWVFVYPLTIIILGFILSLYKGLNIMSMSFGLVVINTFFVGISEEMMFRGVLLTSLAHRSTFWRAAILMSVLFGAVHVLNVVITGELLNAILQAVMATLSGFLFLAIRLKTNSILPAMLIHWLWDLMVFCNTSSLVGNVPNNQVISTVGMLILGISPIIFFILGLKQIRDKKLQEQFMQVQTAE